MVVRKESIIIQLQQPFIDKQTKTQLILPLPSTIYTLDSLFSLLYPHTQKCYLRGQPVILDITGTHTQKDPLDVTTVSDVCPHWYKALHEGKPT